MMEAARRLSRQVADRFAPLLTPEAPTPYVEVPFSHDASQRLVAYHSELSRDMDSIRQFTLVSSLGQNALDEALKTIQETYFHLGIINDSLQQDKPVKIVLSRLGPYLDTAGASYLYDGGNYATFNVLLDILYPFLTDPIDPHTLDQLWHNRQALRNTLNHGQTIVLTPEHLAESPPTQPG